MALKLPSSINTGPLFCDKLSFVMRYKDEGEMKVVASTLHEATKTVGKPYSKFPYRKGVRIGELYEKEKTLKMLVQWDPHWAGAGFVRVDFNPANSDSEIVLAMLHTIFPGGHKDIEKYGVVTRVDATVDLTGVLPYQLLAYYSKKRISAIHCKSGKVETLYLGKRGENNMVAIYDKRRQIKEKNEKYNLELELPSKPTTRVEIRILPECSFFDLKAIKNPFANLLLKTQFPDFEKEQMWRLFVSTSRAVGLQAALLHLDEKERALYSKRVESTPSWWWKPDVIWKAWPEVVESILPL